jgi:hypothetical protein
MQVSRQRKGICSFRETLDTLMFKTSFKCTCQETADEFQALI